MQAQQAPLIFADAERPLGERLMKLALETDRVEGYTEPHAVMIARLAESIGKQVGLHGQDLTALKFAALAHDIGERGLKRNYLLQPNALSWEETLDLWRHPILREQSAAEHQLPRQTQLFIRWHQEFDPQIARLLLAVVVAERRQREAEVWSVPPAFEPPFVPAIEEAPEPAIAMPAFESTALTPINAPDADTLADFAPTEDKVPPAVEAADEYQTSQPIVESAWPSPEEKTPALPDEPKAAASTATVELQEPPVPPSAHIEALTSAPYGDVLMHQAAEDEPFVQTVTDEVPATAHRDSTPDDQQEPTPKIPS